MNRDRVNFRSLPLRQSDQLGVEGNVIKGAVVVQAGALNDERPWHIDETTLAQVVEHGNRRNNGLKARLTHPNMSEDGMGKLLGRWKNFRIDGDKVRADLHISKTADESYLGEIGSYVLSLAEEEPDLFGVSIVSELAEEMFEEDSELFDEELGTSAFRLSALYAADVVDEPAATRGGLFEIDLAEADGLAGLPAVVTRVIDKHFAEATPDQLLSRFEGFLQKYFKDSSISFQRTPSMSEETKPEVEEVEAVEDIQLSNEESVTETPEAQEVQVPESVEASFDKEAFCNQMLEQFGDEGLRLAFQGKSLDEIYAHFRAKDKEQIEELQARLAASQEFHKAEAEELSSDEPVKQSKFEAKVEKAKQAGVASPELFAAIETINE